MLSQSSIEVARTADINLDRLRDCLDRDYIIVIYLLGHTTSSYGEGVLEKMMLAIDYRMMGAWYRVSAGSLPRLRATHSKR